MAKKKDATAVAEETKTDTVRFRIGGAWKNEDKKGNAYLVAPLSPETITNFIAELEKYKENGCKMISYINGFREEEKHPHYVHYIYPFKKKEDE